jgi:hypothetical protein
MFGVMILNDSGFSGLETTNHHLWWVNEPSHGQDVVGVPDGDRHVPPAEDVAEKLQMAEVTVGIWPAGATTGLPRCGFS